MLGSLRCIQARVSSAPCRARHFSASGITDIPKPAQQRNLQPHAFSSFDVNFLGSGGSYSSRFRGMPCMTLVLGSDLWMFDAGEGTVRQTTFARSCVDVTKIFITHMHADHIFGLCSVILNSDTRFRIDHDKVTPLKIYGPHGLYEYICSTLRLSENLPKRKIIVHEMVLSDSDALSVYRKDGHSPWQKPVDAYRRQVGAGTIQSLPNVSCVDVHSSEGLWNLVDDARISVKCGLVSHRIPCFGYIVTETDKEGPLLFEECEKRSIFYEHFLDLKSGKDVTLSNGVVVKAADVIGASVRGRKLVYLGDTSDASNLVSAAMDCDLLVHEATGNEPDKQSRESRGHSTPAKASEMALKCKAKKLILNHIGNQFLPMKATYTRHKNQDIRSDWELLDEAQLTLGRVNDVIVARDFLTVKVPPGGYTSKHMNCKFHVDSAYVAPMYRIQEAAAANKNHDANAPSKQTQERSVASACAGAGPLFKSRMTVPPSTSPSKSNQRETDVPPMTPIIKKDKKEIGDSPIRRRDQQHYIDANMDQWDFDIRSTSNHTKKMPPTSKIHKPKPTPKKNNDRIDLATKTCPPTQNFT